MRMIVSPLAAMLAMIVAGAAEAAGGCGTPDACVPATVEACGPGLQGIACPVNCGRPDCRVVVEMKKVKKHVWVVECEEHCPALPGSCLLGDRRDGCGAGQACGQPAACGTACGKCDPCTAVHARAQTQRPPKCTRVRCRKKLKKKEIECEVPVYKCVPACHAGAARGVCCGADNPAGQSAATHLSPLHSAPLPPVVGTAYLK